MQQQTMKVLFVIKKDKTNSKGICPIKCRVTYLKKRREFSTGQFVNPEHWNSKSQKVTSQDPNSNILNGELLIIQQKLKKVYLNIQLNSIDFNAEDICDSYFGRNIKLEDTVVNTFKRYLKKLDKLEGKEIKQSTINKFQYVCNDVESFVYAKYKKKDIPLGSLSLQFLEDFEYYLKTEKNQKQITTNKAIQRFRKPIRIAVAEGYLEKDPFVLHRTKTVKKQVVFLSTEELLKLENYGFTQARLNLVKDLFVFCCYTGLAYNELSKLEVKHISIGFDNNLWINMIRDKTSKPISIPLLPKARVLVDKYKQENGLIFPKISNQKFNSYLKEIAPVIGVEKNLTTHIARKTFASTVLLYNDVPMEIVSELLGHSSMKVTQESYGKVVQKKVSEAMIKLKSKL
ncbi:site-specific integrase [Formosa sp. PL04]|uniref:site-specific integrase n=1 Tax=Formosa sp. PL04 TaxID=3081755 RepID=UPI002981D0C3|nr:site-specific integrase [Formosa sp. PL04]MDW5289458.1 site-specific integrase [Formosa sp. PL04]